MHTSLLLAALPLVAAHGAVEWYVGHDGKRYEGYNGYNPNQNPTTVQWTWKTYDPIFKVTDPMMTCNGGTPGKLSITIPAGGNITAGWKQWTHQQGPVMVWMYDCEGADFSACNGKSKRWFKIDEAGLYSGKLAGNDWATAVVYNKKVWTSTIPANLKPGNYIIRHELLALHQSNAPQFYPECANLVVTGSGTGSADPSCLKSIPAYADQNDPGVMVNTDNPTSQTYTPPGGRVCPVGGSGGGGATTGGATGGATGGTTGGATGGTTGGTTGGSTGGTTTTGGGTPAGGNTGGFPTVGNGNTTFNGNFGGTRTAPGGTRVTFRA